MVNGDRLGFISGLIILKKSQMRSAAPSKRMPKRGSNALKNNSYLAPLNGI
jgi:hypothetical protein